MSRLFARACARLLVCKCQQKSRTKNDERDEAHDEDNGDFMCILAWLLLTIIVTNVQRTRIRQLSLLFISHYPPQISILKMASIVARNVLRLSARPHGLILARPMSTGAHDGMWKAERYLSVGLLGTLPAAAIYPHMMMDHFVALTLVAHTHWGLEAIVTDYIRPSVFGNTIPKIAIALLYLSSSLALGGLCWFNYSDVGITQATKMLAKM